jgi:DNA-binding NarL/FixJ family response regulator
MANKTVLLIDDSTADRAGLKAQLAGVSGNLAIYEASNGKQGIDLCRVIQPDCVVIELKMEDMIGLEVVEVIQAELNGASAPIFIWTRLQHEMFRYATTSLGLRGFFQKGIDHADRVARAVLTALETVS